MWKFKEADISSSQAILRFLLAMKSWEFSPQFFSGLILQYIERVPAKRVIAFSLPGS